MWVNSGSVEPLIFISISIPINMFKLFNIDNIYNLVETSYSQDFIKKKKKNSYDTSIITLWYVSQKYIYIYKLWYWFVKHGWSFLQTIYIFYIYTHIYYLNFLGKCLFFIWVYFERIYSSSLHKIPGSTAPICEITV